MFWSKNYSVVRELNKLLKEENVTLTQVLEADDILQECKADNTALVLFLTKSEILAELVTLITEEPPKNVDMASQYRHAHIASEVLTSQLIMLSDRLSKDVVQMNRLCDFVNKDPPLNPLLASYFSKTIEMLLEKSPKQDWYLYHIVCLQVLDFFKSRRDFLPNLLRHISTSTIADIFKYFIRLEDPFNKIILEWLEENQFLENLIHIICGTYEPEEIRHAPITDSEERSPDQIEKGQQETSEKVELNHKETNEKDEKELKDENCVEDETKRLKRRAAEAGRASANAAALLCDLLLGVCAQADNGAKPLTSWRLVSRLRSEELVRLLLQCMFTSPPDMRRHAVVNGCQLLLALLPHDSFSGGEGEGEGGCGSASVQRAVAPHLPLLHQALLRPPAGPPPPPPTDENIDRIEEELKEPDNAEKSQMLDGSSTEDNRIMEQSVESPLENCEQPDAKSPSTDILQNEETDKHVNEIADSNANEGEDQEESKTIEESADAKQTDILADKPADKEESKQESKPEIKQVFKQVQTGSVGAARVHVAALVAQLAFSEVEDVHNALLTLGTAGVLIDMFFDYPQNNFLHTQVYILIHNALSNRVYGERYAKHLIDECNLLTRLMDTFEENENTKSGAVRRGNMGHAVLALRRLEAASPQNEADAARWTAFRERTLRPLLERHDTPLGGFYPSKKIYEGGEYYAADTASKSLDLYTNLYGVTETITDVELSCDNAATDSENNFLGMAEQRSNLATWKSYDENEAEAEVEGEAEAEVDGDLDADPDADVEGEADPARVREILADVSPWDVADDNATDNSDWANFGNAFTNPVDPFAPVTDATSPQHMFFDTQQKFTPFWRCGDQPDDLNAEAAGAAGLDGSMQSLNLGGEFQVKPMDEASTAELTNNVLTAMSSMAPEVIAVIVCAMPTEESPAESASNR